jgi:hypothetical protein
MADIKNIIITIKELIAKELKQKPLIIKKPNISSIKSVEDLEILQIPPIDIKINIKTNEKGISKRPKFFLRFTDQVYLEDFLNTFETFPDLRSFETLAYLDELTLLSFNKNIISSPKVEEHVYFEADFFRENIDTIDATDISSKSIGTYSVDSFVVNQFPSFHLNKPSVELIEFLENTRFDTNKYFINTVSGIESLSFNFATNLFDFVSIYDIASVDASGFTSVSMDDYISVDTLFETIWDAIRTHEDIVEYSDSLAIDIYKAINDIVNTSEYLSSSNLGNEAPEEFVSLNEIKSLILNKIFANNIVSDDVLSISPEKLLSETSVVSDGTVYNIGKNPIEFQVISESQTLIILKEFVDESFLYEVINSQLEGADVLQRINSTDIDDLFEKSWNVIREKLSEAIASDSLSIDLEKYLSEASTLSDFLDFVVESRKVNFLNLTKVFSVDIAKLLDNSISSQDIFNLNLLKAFASSIQPDDQPLIEIGKNSLDYSSILEQISYDISTHLLDQLNITEQSISQLQSQESVTPTNNALISEYASFIWNVYRDYLENIINTDIVVKSLGTVSLEDVSVSEAILTYLEAIRNPVEQTTTLEILSIINDIYKTEALAIIEDLQKEVFKTFLESPEVFDIFLKTFEKVHSEEIFLDNVVSKDISKILLDILDIYDMFDLEFQGASESTYSNTANLMDYIEFILSLQRAHLDTANFEEIVDYILEKLFSEVVSSNETLNFTINPIFLDSLYSLENIEKLLNKFAEEEIIIQDSALIHFGNNSSDFLNLEEMTYNLIYKVLLDTLDVYDQFDYQLTGVETVNPSNTANITDLISFIISVYKDFLETSITVDTFEILINKILNDSISSQFVVSKNIVATKLDEFTLEEYLSFSSSVNISEVLIASEFISKLITREFLDQISILDFFNTDESGTNEMLDDSSNITDSGNINIQNYVEAGYFSEDYVGENQTF